MSAPPPQKLEPACRVSRDDKIHAYCPQCEGRNQRCTSCGTSAFNDRLLIAVVIIAAIAIGVQLL